jgi:beta-catenin-like protein 1
LAEELKKISAFGLMPEMYPKLVELGFVADLLSLLAHENSDISAATVTLLNELTDEDALAEMTPEGEQGIHVFLTALLKEELLSILVQNLDRFDPDNTEEKQAIFESMGKESSINGNGFRHY